MLILSMQISAQPSAKNLAEIWDKHHISRIRPSDVRHKDLVAYLDELKKLGLKVDEVGRSNANREIFQIEFGRGPLKVFMWSQMHGDEPTATSALVDMFAYLQRHREKDWVKRIEENLTIRAVPMLNPDGTELYQRRNLQDIDINRDAVNLATPEARILKRLRDEWQPAIGFNLHNQNALTTVGSTRRQAAISLLVVHGDAARTSSEGLERNKRVAAGIVHALNNFIPENIGRYDDEYTSTAFGDNFTAWGTPVILIETGALHGRDEMYLVKMNFVALVTALTSLADGSEKKLSPDAYLALRPNSSGSLYSVIFRAATVIDAADPQKRATVDIGVVRSRRRASFTQSATIRDLGDLKNVAALEDYAADKFVVVQRFGSLKRGELAELLFYKKDRRIDWSSKDLEREFPPDAVFSGGKWTKGEGVVPLQNRPM
ncbi:MAG: M14 family zinc carboxypeptidase [Pyrinomonadaceae bacterium]